MRYNIDRLPGWDDLRFTSFDPKTGAGTFAPTLRDFIATTPAGAEPQLYSYSTANRVEMITCVNQMSHQYDRTSQAYIHAHLYNNEAANSGTIGLFVGVSIQCDGVAAATPEIYWMPRTIPNGTAAKTLFITDDIPLSANLMTKLTGSTSCCILLSVFRYYNNAVVTTTQGTITDTLNQNVWLHEVDIHFFKNKGGTSTHIPPFYN